MRSILLLATILTLAAPSTAAEPFPPCSVKADATTIFVCSGVPTAIEAADQPQNSTGNWLWIDKKGMDCVRKYGTDCKYCTDNVQDMPEEYSLIVSDTHVTFVQVAIAAVAVTTGCRITFEYTYIPGQTKKTIGNISRINLPGFTVSDPK